MNPILKLAFDEFNRSLDRWERRLSESQAAREHRVAAIEPRVVIPERIPATQFDAVVVADNWGGLFDAEVVADNWGGLFEQPAHFLDERDLDLSDTLPFAPAPDAAFDSEFSSTDGKAASTVVADNWGGWVEQPVLDWEERIIRDIDEPASTDATTPPPPTPSPVHGAEKELVYPATSDNSQIHPADADDSVFPSSTVTVAVSRIFAGPFRCVHFLSDDAGSSPPLTAVPAGSPRSALRAIAAALPVPVRLPRQILRTPGVAGSGGEAGGRIRPSRMYEGCAATEDIADYQGHASPACSAISLELAAPLHLTDGDEHGRVMPHGTDVELGLHVFLYDARARTASRLAAVPFSYITVTSQRARPPEAGDATPTLSPLGDASSRVSAADLSKPAVLAFGASKVLDEMWSQRSHITATVLVVSEAEDEIPSTLPNRPWPPPTDHRLTSCDAELRPTPWPSFNMAERFSVRSSCGRLWKPPWFPSLRKLIRCVPAPTLQKPVSCKMVLSVSMAGYALNQDPEQRKCGGTAGRWMAMGLLLHEHKIVIPWLEYHETGREKNCLPRVGRWNMMNKKMVDGGKVRSWICVNFAHNVQDSVVCGFCHALALMCQASGKDFAREPVLPPLYARPDQVERALTVRYHDAMHVLGPQRKELDLLIGILPDNLFQFVRNTPLAIEMSRHAHLQFWQRSEVMLLCWKRWLELLQSAVQDELNCRETVHWLQSSRASILLSSADFWLTCTWFRVYMVQLFTGKLQAMIIFILQPLFQCCPIEVAGIHAVDVSATLVAAGILQNTVVSCSGHFLALVAYMVGQTDLPVTYNSMNTCWDCTLISVLVFGKYLVAASFLGTNSISSKAADVQAGFIVSLCPTHTRTYSMIYTATINPVEWKIQKGMSDTQVWCDGRLLSSIKDLQVPWDPGGTKNSPSAWGQAEAQEEGNVRDHSWLGHHMGPGPWPSQVFAWTAGRLLQERRSSSGERHQTNYQIRILLPRLLFLFFPNISLCTRFSISISSDPTSLALRSCTCWL